MRCDSRPCASEMRCTERRLTPEPWLAAAQSRAWSRGSDKVKSSTRRTTSNVIEKGERGMSEDVVFDYLSDELRRDPTNEYLKRMLRHHLRLLGSRGDRPQPPGRQRDRARERLLADRLLY